ncbi:MULTISPECIES: helix-turn-helix transcriptional regulator [unclassified Streptomyces]|uniref:helix-turn-helix transcriptional regulator n=1 Tax=unclassified Streptomyces TaxID=2593676 RepID=UPI00074AB55C|nr:MULTISPECIES: LuxR family transcriptional regulator [unclassified Streptomyces]KUL52424.1 LuxR family transcriptional regulator [Streptomyces sp. NRRL S-1521]THC51819.1 LuxR family transcriptional regulator [Streptomyces sp. A1499]
MAGSAPRRGLRGRRGECGALDQVIAGARTGRGQVLVLRGDAGVGKSALVEYLVGSAAGCQILRAVGVESEMELAFAGLHQLCVPLMGRLDRIPGPQRDALSVAFGLSAGSAPDRFLVGLAVLSLLAEAAEEQPIVCVVDDAQWLDQVSAQTLAFVARRVLAERVALVFALRTPAPAVAGGVFAGLREIVVRGLRDDDARALLKSVVPGRLDEGVRDRIVAETRGNPLALLELTRGLTAAELAGGFGRPDARPLASQIEESYLRRIGALPAAAQRLLLAAAAEPVGDAPLLRRVAERLDIDADAAGAVEAAGLIEFGTRVRFRHPLVRSAAYRAADPTVRRDVHRALAEATDPDFDSDRQAWHRAHAAVDPDEALAAELERSAGRAQARGGIAAAAAFLRRATELTPDPVRRGMRAEAAAQAAFDAGSPDAALELLAAARLSPLDEAQQARLTWLRAQIVFARRRGGEALPLLLDAAGRLARVDEAQAREAYLDAIGSAVFAGRMHGRTGVREVAEAARTALLGSRPARPTDLLLDGLVTWFADGCVEGAPLLRSALQAFRRAAGHDAGDATRWLWLLWLVAGDLWDDETWHELTTHAVRSARETGALNFLPLALGYRAALAVHAGDFDLASTLVEEAATITEVTGHSPMAYPSLLLMAWRGEDARAAEVMQSAVGDATSWGEGRAIGLGHYLLAVLYNGLGQYQDALTHAGQAVEHEDVSVVGFALAELVEAAARSGAPEAAAAALCRLEERTGASGTDWALGVLARSRALLCDGPAADRLYREAIEHLGRSRIAVHLSRAHLVYGEWLRRENRRVDAREHLRTAHEMLRGFGASAFAERARRELLATGETVRRRQVEVGDLREALTAQERQVARLAADGMTNSEIGAALFISPRTVEWHLGKVFTKLDVKSRNKLRTALAGP